MYPHPDPAQEIRTRLWLWRWLWLGDQETFKLNSDYSFWSAADPRNTCMQVYICHNHTILLLLCTSVSLQAPAPTPRSLLPWTLTRPGGLTKFFLESTYLPTYIHTLYMVSPSLRYLFGGTFLCNNRSYFYLCIRDIPAL